MRSGRGVGVGKPIWPAPAATHGAKSLVLAIVLAFVVVGAGACGRDDEDVGAARPPIEILDQGPVPTELLGLEVQPEPLESLAEVDRPFVDAVGLYSLRAPDEALQATLQLSRFSPSADVDSEQFRQSVIAQIGSSTPRAFRMGSHTVHLTTGRRQNVAVWFKGRHFFVLSTREEYEQPRALLRATLAIEPEPTA